MKKTARTLSYLLVLSCLFGIKSASAKTIPAETWTVRGKIKVQHLQPELRQVYGNTSALAGIQVKVYARAKNFAGWGTWNAWPVVKTRSDGSFTASKRTGNDRRQFKIEILFDSNELRIKEGQETALTIGGDGFPIDVQFDLSDKDWHEVHNDKSRGNERKAGVTDLGDLVLSRTLLRKHGDIWFSYNKVFDKFNSFGGDYGFKRKVIVKYPMGIGNNSSASASYANPVNHTVYLKEDNITSSRGLRTMLHELMHIWMYRHCTGEDNMAWQLAKHQSTHQARENTTFVPFHEGFADWSSYKLLRIVTNGQAQRFNSQGTSTKPHAPYKRSHIGQIENILANVDYTERGWVSLFNVLSYNNLGKVDFNGSGTYAERTLPNCNAGNVGLSLKEVLGTFLKNSGAGYPQYMGKNDMNFDDYLNRVRGIRGFNAQKIQRIKSYVNPQATENPRDYYCGGASTQPSKGVLKPGTLIKKSSSLKKN